MAETLFKLAETVFLSVIRDKVEEKMGFFQHAYKRNRSCKTAIEAVFSAVKKLGTGFVFCLDVASAFEGVDRGRMLKLMIKAVGN